MRNLLFPYQQEGVDFILGRRRSYLCDQMGLGKTVQAIMAGIEMGPEIQSVLVVCPASVRENWDREIRKWAGAAPWTWKVESYASRAHIEPGDWDLVILDEAHYLKNPKAKRTKKWLPIAAGAKRAILLSGTPMPNDPSEFWPAFRYLWPELVEPAFDGPGKWLRHFCRYTMTQYGPRVYGMKNTETLKGMLAQVALRRTLDDIANELPELRVTLHMLPKDAGFDEVLVDQTAEDLLTLIKNEQTRDNPSGAKIRRLIGEYKAPRVAEIIAEELDQNAYRKVAVLYYHKAVGLRLRDRLSEFGVLGFDGSTPAAQRQKAIDQFITGPERVFVAQQQSAGTGIDGLQRVCSEIVLVEPDWSPDANRQAIKRIHRLGQEHPCRARVFAVSGSIDQGIMQTIAAKASHQQELGI